MDYKPYSISKISTFNSCQYKFKLTYIDDIKIPSNNYYLFKGSHIHKILEHEFNYDIEFDISDNYNRKDHNNSIMVVKKFENSILGKTYKKLLKIGVKEEDFAISRELDLVGFKSKLAWLRGSADLYYIKNNNGYIIDWKSGKSHANESDFGVRQGKMYAIYLFIKYPQLNEVKSIFVFIEHNNQKVITYSRTELMKYINDFTIETTLINNNKVFYQNFTPLCDYCDYKKLGICPGEIKNRKSEEIDWF